MRLQLIQGCCVWKEPRIVHDSEEKRGQKSMTVSRFSWNCVILCSAEKAVDEHIMYGVDEHSSTIAVCRPQVPLAQGLGAERYHVYFIPKYLHLKGKIPLAHVESMTVEATVGAD